MNKYLEKIAEFDKEAMDLSRVLGATEKKYGEYKGVRLLDKKMEKKMYEHLDKGNSAKFQKVLQNKGKLKDYAEWNDPVTRRAQNQMRADHQQAHMRRMAFGEHVDD